MAETAKDLALVVGGAAVDVSGVHSPRTLAFGGHTGGGVLVVEESADNFVADIVPVALVNLLAGGGVIAAVVDVNCLEHDWPDSRVGAAGVKMRARCARGGVSGNVTLRATATV